MATVPHLRPLATLLFMFLISPLSALAISESNALLLLKKSFANVKALDSWSDETLVCTKNSSWVGVVCFHGIVMGLRLSNMDLAGTVDVDALLQLPGLRSISFTNNGFTGPIPSFNRIGALKAIYLSGNRFSGEIPSDFFSQMESLKKVWLSENAFTGLIPSSLNKPSRLVELHLENNQFSGNIPPIEQATLKSFNVSNNVLEGEIPATFQKFDATSFLGNEGLCGLPLGKQCLVAEAEPIMETSVSGEPPQDQGRVALVTIVVILVVCLVGMVVSSKKRREREFDKLNRDYGEDAFSVHVPESIRTDSSVRKDASVRRDASRRGSAVPQLMIVNQEKGMFGMTDLMKAAAEVLGNGGLGSSYKAVMGNGVSVVVKRMREMNRVGDDGFEMEMRRLGSLRHPNILPPLAFHFRKEEKLLVFEYIPRGSLLYLLHGDRGPGHDELNWLTRLRIVRGISRGIAHIHTELSQSEIPHGNLKSSNVLLKADLEPLLIDYGYWPLVTPHQASQSMFAYKCPEAIQYHHVSPKSDVYCLGIVILEILTGKFPSQYLSNGKGGTDVVQWVTTAIQDKREFEVYDPEIVGSAGSADSSKGMESLLHLGAACADPNPEQRPDIKEVVRRIEEIATDEKCDEDRPPGPTRDRTKNQRQNSHRRGTSSHRSKDSIGSVVP